MTARNSPRAARSSRARAAGAHGVEDHALPAAVLQGDAHPVHAGGGDPEHGEPHRRPVGGGRGAHLGHGGDAVGGVPQHLPGDEVEPRQVGDGEDQGHVRDAGVGPRVPAGQGGDDDLGHAQGQARGRPARSGRSPRCLPGRSRRPAGRHRARRAGRPPGPLPWRRWKAISRRRRTRPRGRPGWAAATCSRLTSGSTWGGPLMLTSTMSTSAPASRACFAR